MADKNCIKRLQKEYHALCKAPVPQIVAKPLPSNILEWHYVLEGSEHTPFSGGYYYGKIKFPPEYPYKPPSITMITPNGRFAVNRKICLSMSDFHPESWNPIWSVSSILTGLLSFMMDDDETTGSIKTSDEEKRKLACLSLAFNCDSKNCINFKKLFPEYVEKYKQQLIGEQPAEAPDIHQEQSTVPVARGHHVAREAQANIVGNVAAGQVRQKQPLPSWLVVLVVSVLSVVMALPLLQP